MRLGGRAKLLAVLATVGLAAISAAATATAPAATQGEPAAGTVISDFGLTGTHGYEIQVTAVGGVNGESGILVSTRRRGLQVTYEMRTRPAGSGVHAQIGSVSTIAVDFEKRERMVIRPEKGCTWIRESGVFKGEFRFTGELGYTSARKTSIPGKVTRLPNGFCGFGDDRPGMRRLPSVALRATQVVAAAPIPHGEIRFGASMLDGDRGRTIFSAQARETIGPLKITRIASAATAGKGTFTLDPAESPGGASVYPPLPFEGSARLQPGPGNPVWTGSLQVALPGTPTMSLAGPSFAARLCPSISILRECKLGSPPARARAL